MGNSASGLPYSIGKEVGFDPTGWKIHEGNRKSDNEVVSVFVGKKATMVKTPISMRFPNMMQLTPALHHYQNCKRLRHPYILQVLATLDTDHPDEGSGAPSMSSSQAAATTTGDLIVVTESCVPLESWMQSSPSAQELSWGLECMIKALHFLHTSAKLVHGNLAPSSFYVTQAGDVKLWNFNIVTSVGGASGTADALSSHFQEWEGMVTPDPYRSPERHERRWDAVNATGIHAMDSYALGVLIDHVYSGSIPVQLQKAVQRLQTSNIRMRPRLQPLLKCPVFDTPYSKLQGQLEQISVQPIEQKVAFWHTLGTTMESPNSFIQSNMAVYKITPLIQTTITTICQNDSMLAQDLYRREILALINPLFYIAENFLPVESYDRVLKPIVGMLFAVKDRAVRGAILGKISFLSQHMDKHTLNSKVFEPLCSGFSDSSSALRELSLKAALTLVPHLTPPNLEKLSRYLVRLQGDSEASIRTNTIIFIGKLAPNLTEAARQKLIMPAFCRAMKDPFAPCRLTALTSLTTTKQLFDEQSLAGRVLPAITPMLLDPVESVRQKAFTVVDVILAQLREVSSTMGCTQQQTVANDNNKQQNNSATTTTTTTTTTTQTTAPPPAPSSGGYGFSSLTSWMSTSTQADPTPAPAPAPAPAPVPTPMPIQTPPPQQVPAPMANTTAQFNSLTVKNTIPAADDNDGWDNDDDVDGGGWDDVDDDVVGVDDDDQQPAFGAAAPPVSAKPLITPQNHNDDPFAMIGMKNTTNPATRLSVPTTTKKINASSGASGSLIVPKKKIDTPKIQQQQQPAKPAVQKLKVDDGWGDDDGWDDF